MIYILIILPVKQTCMPVKRSSELNMYCIIIGKIIPANKITRIVINYKFTCLLILIKNKQAIHTRATDNVPCTGLDVHQNLHSGAHAGPQLHI